MCVCMRVCVYACVCVHAMLHPDMTFFGTLAILNAFASNISYPDRLAPWQ